MNLSFNLKKYFQVRPRMNPLQWPLFESGTENSPIIGEEGGTKQRPQSAESEQQNGMEDDKSSKGNEDGKEINMEKREEEKKAQHKSNSEEKMYVLNIRT